MPPRTKGRRDRGCPSPVTPVERSATAVGPAPLLAVTGPTPERPADPGKTNAPFANDAVRGGRLDGVALGTDAVDRHRHAPPEEHV
jgi:hypothetical protein